MVMERRESPMVASGADQPRQREESARRAKPFEISKREVWQACCQVKANRGAAGVDRETIEVFDQDLKGNLYKLWNRLSSCKFGFY